MIFSGMLLGCGHSTDVATTSDLASLSTPTITDTSPTATNQAASTPTDPVSKAMVMIDSPNYAGELVFSLEDYDAATAVQKQYPDVTFKSKFGDSVLLDRERRRLEKVTGKKLPDLRRHLIVEAKDRAKAKIIFEKVARDLATGSTYPRLKGSAPGINTVPDLTGLQGYLSDLNISAMWEAGITGDNTSLIDQNDDVNPNHEDLPHGLIPLDSGSARAIGHGTAVMGIIVGLDNGHGVKGVVPNAGAQTSYAEAAWIGSLRNGSNGPVGPGGILHLLEEQYPNPASFPYSPCDTSGSAGEDCVSAESYADSFEAYQIATAVGIPVILPAANGRLNFDTMRYLRNWPDLSRDDSGAIVVGASTGANHRKADFSNCGRRVNLFAWGAGVVSASYPGSLFGWSGSGSPNNGDPNAYFTNQFGGTSSAAAIITGTVSLLQSYSMREMGSGYKGLTPEKIREILIASGVPAQDEGGCSIGKQPRMDVAMQIFDSFWRDIQRDFPEIGRGQEIKGARRQMLRQRGIQLICNYHRPDLSDPNCAETARCVVKDIGPIEDYLDQHVSGWRYPSTSIPRDVAEYLKGLGYQVVGPPGPRKVEIILQDPSYCQGSAKPACVDIDYAQSDYDCAAGSIWPTGVGKCPSSDDLPYNPPDGAWYPHCGIAKPLDIDGDGKADLVNWTNTGWQLALSSKGPIDASRTTWDYQINVPMNMGRWVWPVVDDYNSDGRADLAVWDKEHGVWYIK
ncbi:MAG: S8 family serine peptidase, partial [Candidatus Magasanikbacteria bacterium]|nr:S8 family serine peptidase [Candidatus Magasanikbacteria bacterium]